MTNRALVPGLLLIGLGAYLFLVQLTEAGGEAVVAVIGGALLVAYAFTRHYGLLVPGGILTGLGLGILWVSSDAGRGGAVLIGLGLGFGLVALADVMLKHTRAPWWPVIPGGIVTTIGMLIETQRNGLLDELTWVWPAAMIVAGAVLLVVQMTKRPSDMGAAQPRDGAQAKS